MKPRKALPSDADALTRVIVQAMPLDPQWNYRFPYREEYPEDHYKFSKMLFEYFLHLDYDDWLVMVVEDSPESDGNNTSIVSFAIWDVSYVNKRRYGPGYKPQDRKSSVHAVTEVEKRGGSTRRDANHAHFDAFWKQQIQAYKRHFAPIGPEQLHLQVLATLPEFQRRGHASALCRWGMEEMQREGLKDISVMASPMGYALYTHLGFETVAKFYIQVPGEKERLTIVAMMYKARK